MNLLIGERYPKHISFSPTSCACESVSTIPLTFSPIFWFHAQQVQPEERLAVHVDKDIHLPVEGVLQYCAFVLCRPLVQHGPTKNPSEIGSVDYPQQEHSCYFVVFIFKLRKVFILNVGGACGIIHKVLQISSTCLNYCLTGFFSCPRFY